METNEIITLLTSILSQNYFEFNNKIYTQADGVAMGSSIASTLADIFINTLEDKLFTSEQQILKQIIYYYRHVDDTPMLINGTNDDTKNLSTF